MESHEGAGDWELVDKPAEQPSSDSKQREAEPAQPAPAAPESLPHKAQQAGKAAPQGVLEVLTAKGLFCLLCVMEAAVKMTAHATQMAHRVGMAGAHVAHKLCAAAQPALASVHAGGAACVAALRRGDARGAATLVGQYASEAAAWLVAALGPWLAAIRDVVRDTAASWHVAAPTCCCIPSTTQLREKQRRLLASAQSSAAAAGEWASTRWHVVDPAGRLLAAWRRARSARSGTYIAVVLGLGCASLAVGALLLRFAL